MNEPTIRLEARPEITAFVERVRARLSDLSDEDREELVGGLEADIAELVADGGSVAELGDPRAYADELRSAAGVARRPADEGSATGGLFRGRPHRRLSERVDAAFDGARRRWAELVGVPALATPWEFVLTLRPVWWVLRAWVAMQLLALFLWGGQASAVPMVGGPLVGTALWLTAVVVSVQIGRGALWPGSGPDRPVAGRLVLLALNGFAVLMLPLVAEQLPAGGVWSRDGYVDDYVEPVQGLVLDGEAVGNVFPYDAEGRPLSGVQLFTDSGAPLRVAPWAGQEYGADGDRVSVVYPWLNGEQELYNVFPLPRRSQDLYDEGDQQQPDAWTSTNPPALPTAPLAVVPPATLPAQPTEPPAEKTPEQPSAVDGDSENARDR